MIRLLLLLLVAAPAFATPRADPLTWTQSGTTMSGYVVWDDATATVRPGLVMVPNWMGVDAAAVEKAKTIAGTRYVVLLADVYGRDLRPKNNDEAGKAAGALYADRKLLRARANAAVTTLAELVGKVPVDPQRIAAIGFCFGGSAVLELARSGAALRGFVSFHCGLGTDLRATPGGVRAPVLVLHGAADSYVPAVDVTALQQEMTAAGADWQFVSYSGAVHCFTEPGAASPGCLYDEKVSRRAYAAMEGFLAEVFGSGTR